MEKAMNNKGYMAARVDVDTVSKGKRMDVFYRVSANTPHYIDDIDYRISNDTISRLVERQYASHSLLKKDRISIEMCWTRKGNVFPICCGAMAFMLLIKN